MRENAPDVVRSGDGWLLISRFAVPRPDRVVREMTTFVEEADGRSRRDDERHENVLIDTAALPGKLRPYGIEATIGAAFGDEQLPDGLVTVIGRKL